MRKQSKRVSSKAIKPGSPPVPDFESEAEEAAWWDKNLDKFHNDVLERGEYRPAFKVRRRSR